MTSIPTLRQYAQTEWERMRAEYGVTVAEASDLYPVTSFEADWFRATLASVDAGNVPSWQLWRSLTDHQRSHLLRTSRALRDDAFTRKLVALNG